MNLLHASLVMSLVGLPVRAFASAPTEDPKARALLEEAKAAAGGSAWDRIGSLHEVLSIDGFGLKGKGEGWTNARNGTYANTFQMGPESGAEGWNGKIHWTQDHSGQVRPETGGDGVVAAKTEAFRQSMAYWYPSRKPGVLSYAGQKTVDGHSYDMVRAAPEGGRAFELWIDRATHRIERLVEKKEIDTVTSTFSDWRLVEGGGGIILPHTQRDSIGEAKYDQVSTILSVDFPPTLPPDRFDPPAPPPSDFAFAGAVEKVTVPFRLNNNHIYLSAKVNGKPVTLVFDTGATNYLYSESAKRLGVHVEGALPGTGVGEKKEDTGLAKVESIELGGLTIRTQIFAVASSGGWTAIEGVPSDGLLGYEVVKRVPTIIDYAREQLTFVKPSAFHPTASVRPIAFRFAEHLPEIDGFIDGLPARMHIDTGSRAGIDLTSPYIEKNALLKKYAPKREATTGWGVGGAARSKLARAHTLTLGNQVLREPVIELTSQTTGAFSSAYYDGNVGGELLRRFTLTLDYAHQQLWLEPNDTAGSPFVFDRSGMFLATEGDGFVIKDVTENGPAASAGLKAGDLLVQINGKNSRGLPLPRLREWLKSAMPGTKVPVTLSGGRTVTVTLADLV